MSAELADIDRAVERLFTPSNTQRLQALRALLVEKLDFDQRAGAMLMPSVENVQMQPAQLIAQRDGVTAVFVAAPSDSVLAAAALRNLYRASAKELVDVLLVCSTNTSNHWQFVYSRLAGGKEVLCRLSVQKGQPRRTFVEQLANLMPHAATRGIRSALEQLYDVEAVTKQFFAEYRRVFDAVLASVVGLPDDEERRLFCQTLFNRLMFLYFLQRKGCLTFGGDPNYVNALWKDYERAISTGTSSEGSFYRIRLRNLFSLALNNVRNEKYDAVQLLEHEIGRVPFLNGGLFAEDDLDRRPGVDVPDDAIRQIITGLFDRFNFTITESTPYDVEVAVDPEMLGKVFEELVTGRHESGSYYTPRPIVAFMGKEALKGYFAHATPEESPEAIAGFVDEHIARKLRNPGAVWEALKRVRICDPACGSGAYLLGMLQELLALRTCLFAAHRMGPEDVYGRKLEIIQENLYGVDIDPFAVNVARLRLWLSLIVDYAGADPPPLPNLDFKIEQGDSLTAPSPGSVAQTGAREHLIPKYREAKSRFIAAFGEEKRLALADVNELRQDIATWTHGNALPNGAFDWAVEFAEVFTDGGFDILLANPPYVRADENDRVLEYRRNLKQAGIYSTLHEKWDLYIAFLERGYQLLKTDGQSVFIIPDAFTFAKYGTRSRQFIAKNTEVLRIDFCGDLPIFQAGVRNIIMVLRKRLPGSTHKPLLARRWGDRPDEFEANCAILPTQTQSMLGENIFREAGSPKKIDYIAIPLEDICYVRACSEMC